MPSRTLPAFRKFTSLVCGYFTWMRTIEELLRITLQIINVRLRNFHSDINYILIQLLSNLNNLYFSLRIMTLILMSLRLPQHVTRILMGQRNVILVGESDG